MYLNKALIAGNLTRDPEIKALPSGGQVASFSIATNRRFKGRDGQMQEQTDFHNIVVFGNQAENSARFLRKGSQVFVEGRLQTRSWESDGQRHYRTEVVADQVTFGSRPKENQDSEEDRPPHRKAPSPVVDEAPKYEYPEEEINPEDIPF